MTDEKWRRSRAEIAERWQEEALQYETVYKGNRYWMEQAQRRREAAQRILAMPNPTVA
jgi:hypothetical protein